MSRAVLWVTPAVAVVAVLLLGTGAGTLAVAAVLLLGLAAGVGLWALEVARVRRLARTVNRWVGLDTSAPVELGGGAQWRELGTTVNALGAQLRDVRRELGSVVPWTERLVASLDDPAVVLDEDRRLVAANAAAAELLRLSTGSGARTALSVLGSSAASGAVEEAADSGRIVTVDDRRGDRELRVTASPLDDHVLVVLADRTRERRVEELRRDFVTNASHELKTPVTSIVALAEALEVAPADRHGALVARLSEEAGRLMRLVRDLLDLRALEDPDRSGERRPVDLVELVRAAVEAHGSAAARADVSIATELPERSVVTGVEHELRLVVDNLVANAVQYNREGGDVTVSLRAEDGLQVLEVRDTGIGIPQQALDRVFERFYRVDVARSRDRGGTGLGLSLVRNAVERHGGRVAVESLLGSGTTVTVRLPVRQPDR